MVSPRLLQATLLLLAGSATWLTRGNPGGNPGRNVQNTESATPNAVTKSNGRAPTLTVEMTAYTSAPAQTDATPKLTASGAEAGPGTAAVSRDLLGRLPYGTQVAVVSVSGEGCGGWVPETPLTVADTMNPRIENHLDVWLETTEQALNWGQCQAEIEVLGKE